MTMRIVAQPCFIAVEDPKRLQLFPRKFARILVNFHRPLDSFLAFHVSMYLSFSLSDQKEMVDEMLLPLSNRPTSK